MSTTFRGLTIMRRAALLITTCTLCSAWADPSVIALSAADQQRLGIEFDEVKANSSADGFQVPAQVIESPDQRSQVTAFFSGTLGEWHLQGGQPVQRGQIVASINSPELMVLQEQWLAADNHLQDVSQQLQKDKQLLADGVISEQRLRQTQRAHRQAVFNLQARRQQLYQAGVSDADLNALQTGEQLPGHYYLRAPQTGTFNRHLLAVGDTIASSQQIASVTDPSALWLRARLPLALAKRVNTGDRLQLAEGMSSLTLVSKNTALHPSTQQIEILAQFDRPGHYFPGQQVALIVPAAGQGFRIPAAAVTHTGDATIVFIKRKAGIEARALDLVPLGEDYLAINNIDSSEQLVVQGSAQLKGIQLGLGGGE